MMVDTPPVLVQAPAETLLGIVDDSPSLTTPMDDTGSRFISLKRPQNQSASDTNLCPEVVDGGSCSNNYMSDDGPVLKKAFVLCCNCGLQMEANPTGMCVQCVKHTVSITKDLARSVVLPHCRECERYLGDSRWMKCERESKELLALCLKKIKGLGARKGCQLIDATFLWTEEHSKRLRVKLLVQGEIHSGAALQQEVVVDFQIANKQCEDCCRSYTPHTWKAAVQVRQKVTHRRTLMHLEQLILSHGAQEKLLFVSQSPEGLDFHFNSRSHAQRFGEFIKAWTPTKHQISRTLVSHDTKSNTYNYKYTQLITIAPPCRDDLVFLTKKVSGMNGGISQLCLVHKVSTSFHLIDPSTLISTEIATQKYWENPFETVLDRKHLMEFIVLDKEELDQEEVLNVNVKHGKRVAAVQSKSVMESQMSRGSTVLNGGLDGDCAMSDVVGGGNGGPPSTSGGFSFATTANLCFGRKRFQLCEVEIARVSDFGHNDVRCKVRCHLGHLLEPGDHVLGYDMRSVCVSGMDDDRLVAGGFKQGKRGGKKEKNSNSNSSGGGNNSSSSSNNELSKLFSQGLASQDVILVRKKYGVSANAADAGSKDHSAAARDEKRALRRAWELRRLAVNKDEHANGKANMRQREEERDLELYKQDLEEDPELRREVQMFKVNPNKGMPFSKREEREKEKAAAALNLSLNSNSNSISLAAAGSSTNTVTNLNLNLNLNGNDKDYSDEEDMPHVPVNELADLMGDLTVHCGGAAFEDYKKGEGISSDDDDL